MRVWTYVGAVLATTWSVGVGFASGSQHVGEGDSVLRISANAHPTWPDTRTALAAGVEGSASLRTLSLVSGGQEDLTHLLGAACRRQESITDLTLENCALSGQTPFLPSLKTLVQEHLMGLRIMGQADFRDEGRREFYGAVRTSTTLARLSLYVNPHGEAMQDLKHALAHTPGLVSLEVIYARHHLPMWGGTLCGENHPLEALLLRQNTLETLRFFTHPGMMPREDVHQEITPAAMVALGANTSLRVLDLERGRLSVEATSALLEALKTNQTLQTLYVGELSVQESEMPFRETLQANTTLTSLGVGCFLRSTGERVALKSSPAYDALSVILQNNSQRPRSLMDRLLKVVE